MDNQIRSNNHAGATHQPYMAKGPETKNEAKTTPENSAPLVKKEDLTGEDAYISSRMISDSAWNMIEPEVTVFDLDTDTITSYSLHENSSDSQSVDLEQKNTNLSIIFTNDLHGNLDPNKGKGGMAYVAGKIDSLRKKNPDSLVLDGGDMAYAPPYSDRNRFNPMAVIMDEIKYDAMVTGNHEFQWEARKHDGPEGNPHDHLIDNLKELCEQMNFPVLCANAERRDLGKRPDYLQPYIIKQVGGVNVGIIGVVTKKMATQAHPEVAEGWNILDQADSINKFLPEMKEKGADIIVVISHDSLGRNEDMIRNTHGIDIVIGGHDHQVTDKPILCTNADGKNVPLVEAGAHGYVVGQLSVDIDPKSKKVKQVVSTLHPVIASNIKPDEKISNIVDQWIQKSKG